MTSRLPVPFYNSVEEYQKRRHRMKFTIKIWKFSVTIDLFDLDLSDGDVAVGITISWKE